MIAKEKSVSKPAFAVAAILLLSIALAVADLLIPTISVVLLLFGGVLFGIFLNGITEWVAKRTGFAYGWTYGMMLVVLAGLTAAGLYFMGASVAERFSELWTEIKSSVQNIPDQIEQYPWAKSLMPEKVDWQKVMSPDGMVMKQLATTMGMISWGLTGLVVVLFVGIYVAYDPHLYSRGMVKLVPPARRERAEEVMEQLRGTLGRWIIGRLVSMTIVGVLTAMGLWWLDIPLPITLGVVAALLTFIPNFGPILAAIPQMLLAMQAGQSAVVNVILLNIALQTVESYLITPMVQRIEVSLPPALTIAAQLLMGVLVGVIGIVMAAPLTAVAMVLLQMLYIQDRLNDPDPGQPVSNDPSG